ncbi:hypothetical protein TNCV_3657191 [Trichonephila clavipes]|nr:hypothetical protein TNCV_3657191 [Trichonephila clavipes]
MNERKIKLKPPSHQTTLIHSPSNLFDQPGFGFVISRSNKLRFVSRLHTRQNRFNPSSFSFSRDSACQNFNRHSTVMEPAMNVELLISKVAENKAIYDSSDIKHSNRNFISHLWRKIGEEMSMPGESISIYSRVYTFRYTQYFEVGSANGQSTICDNSKRSSKTLDNSDTMK